MSHTKKIIRLANHFQNKLHKAAILDVIDHVQTTTKDPITLACESIQEEDWKANAESMEEFERKWNLIKKLFDTLAMVPSPVGNPFSLGMIADAIQNTNYVDAAFYLLGALPMLAFLRPATSYLLIPHFSSSLLSEVPAIFKPLMKKILIWLARNLQSKMILNSISMCCITLLDNVMETATKSAINEIIDVIKSKGYQHSQLQQTIETKKATTAQQAKYIADYLTDLIFSGLQSKSKEIMQACLS